MKALKIILILSVFIGVTLFLSVNSYVFSTDLFKESSTLLEKEYSGINQPDAKFFIETVSDVPHDVVSLLKLADGYDQGSSKLGEQRSSVYCSTGCSEGCSTGCSTGCSSGCSYGCSSGCSYGCSYGCN